MCAAGPPKLMAPSFRKSAASSRRQVPKDAGGESWVSCGSFTPSLWFLPARLRESRGGCFDSIPVSRDSQKEQAHQHGEIGASVTHPEPESLSSVSQLRNFRGHDSSADDDEKGNRCDPARTSSPQTISNVAPKCAVKAGREKPIRVKRSPPVVPAKLVELSRKVIQLTPLGSQIRQPCARLAGSSRSDVPTCAMRTPKC
jgi:hypothetical protein